MQLLELLPAEHIVAPLRATTLRDALVELVERLDSRGLVSDAEAVLRSLTGPRGRDLVFAGDEVALPHFRSDTVPQLAVALGVAPDGLDARDLGFERRPRIVALILAPTGAATLYLQTVAALARLFREPGTVNRIAAEASAAAVLAAAEQAGLRIQPLLTVRDVMVHSADAVGPSTPVRDAVALMIRRRLRALPVVGEKQEVLGIVTERDVMRGLLPHVPRAGQEAGQTPIPDTLRVRDIMSRSVLCISEDMGLEEAASMMINKDVEQFPVTSEGRLTGFLTRGDMVRKLFGR
jgi:CBS domain-containing protein/mannitol/fructose-specific phosphotransferase system IIA component (Ntr-type)